MAKKKTCRKIGPEPVEVTIYTPVAGSEYKSVVIAVSVPGRSLLEVEMAFDGFWKAVCKLPEQSGKMTQWVEADDENA